MPANIYELMENYNKHCVICDLDISNKDSFIIVFHRNEETGDYKIIDKHMTHLKCYHKGVYEQDWNVEKWLNKKDKNGCNYFKCVDSETYWEEHLICPELFWSIKDDYDKLNIKYRDLEKEYNNIRKEKTKMDNRQLTK